jgi:hypothetical protein
MKFSCTRKQHHATLALLLRAEAEQYLRVKARENYRVCLMTHQSRRPTAPYLAFLSSCQNLNTKYELKPKAIRSAGVTGVGWRKAEKAKPSLCEALPITVLYTKNARVEANQARC